MMYALVIMFTMGIDGGTAIDSHLRYKSKERCEAAHQVFAEAAGGKFVASSARLSLLSVCVPVDEGGR